MMFPDEGVLPFALGLFRLNSEPPSLPYGILRRICAHTGAKLLGEPKPSSPNRNASIVSQCRHLQYTRSESSVLLPEGYFALVPYPMRTDTHWKGRTLHLYKDFRSPTYPILKSTPDSVNTLHTAVTLLLFRDRHDFLFYLDTAFSE